MSKRELYDYLVRIRTAKCPETDTISAPSPHNQLTVNSLYFWPSCCLFIDWRWVVSNGWKKRKLQEQRSRNNDK
ncbi:hypothetical protein SAMN05421747_11571 [Parapedobacter composti]|uniref:Uncharacterized protein n=1 Tax=Parapedobacter composti TaxID=623281 RepID=A0A1I1KK24_9SPHI|nr:hypothetical protein SAMN05421747_11571 [Parapedobacter composti]